MTVISFRHNFVFIKTSKTAGTSIEVDLSKIAGDDAIVTPIIPEVAGHQARNYLASDGSPAFYNHMTAELIRDRIGARAFDRMYKFCVERDPVTKCISHFHMLRNSPIHSNGGRYRKSWQEYCDAGDFPIDLNKYTAIRDNRRVCLADIILAYEHLETALPQLLGRFGITGFALTTRAKSEYSRTRLVAPGEVTQRQRSQIYLAFAPTIAVTGMYAPPL